MMNFPKWFVVQGWGEGHWYYQGAYDVADVLGFVTSRTGDLLNYHLPQAVAIPVVGALALMLMASLKRRRLDAIAVLALLAVGIAIFAALLVLYPLGGIQQNLYLGPVIFLAAGVAIHWMADSLAALMRRAWLAPGLVVAAAGAIALAGVGDIRQDSPYEKDHNAKAVLAFLEEHVEEGDMVYATSYAATSLKFYQDEKSSSYHYGQIDCWSAYDPCIREMTSLLVSLPNAPNRIFLVYYRTSMLEELELLEERVLVEHVVAHSAHGQFALALIANAKEFKEFLEAAARSDYEALVAGEPAVRADFDIYINDNTLTYAKESCARADTEARFFLHLVPADVADLLYHRRQHGFDNRGFGFATHGVIFDGGCMAMVTLPEYDISRIRTGQFLVNEDGSYTHLWGGEIRFDEPLIRSNFDVYLDEDQLTYIKEPCARADTEARFFLHLVPADVADLPAERKQYGFDNLGFRFNDRDYEFRSAEQCIVWRELPDYAITRIRTGQFLVNEDGFYTNIWEGEIRFDE